MEQEQIKKEVAQAETIKSQTKDGAKLEKQVKKGLTGFSLMFANAIKFDDLAKAIKNGKL